MFVAMGLGRFSYTAMVPALIAAGQLTPLEAGQVGMFNLAGFFAGALLSLTAAGRLGRARLLRAAAVVAMAGLAGSALAGGFVDLAAWRGLIGVATGVIMVLSLAAITETAPPTHRAAAGGYVFAGVGLGILTSSVLVPVLLSQGLSVAWWSLAVAGAIGAALALWGWHADPGPPPPADIRDKGQGPLAERPMQRLLLAHFLFSLAIVPHSLYWVDFIVREQGQGFVAGGVHWAIVGVCAILGPLVCTQLARIIGTSAALVLAFGVLAAGIAAPALFPVSAILLLSSVLFGAQPGLSGLMAARARELARAEVMGPVMRAMILANATGAVVAGMAIPAVYARLPGAAALFLTAGAAMLAAAAAAWPGAAGRSAWRRRWRQGHERAGGP
jgi:predicted MFS family arabinose efflux permease